MGMEAALATNKCADIKIGHKIMRVSPDNVIFGSFPNSL